MAGIAAFARIEEEKAMEWTTAMNGKALEKRFTFADFSAAFAFLTRVAMHAEKVHHHPDFTVRWNRVDFSLSSHDADAVTPRDHALAAAIDAIAASSGVQLKS